MRQPESFTLRGYATRILLFKVDSVRKSLLSTFTHTKNAPADLWRRYQTNFGCVPFGESKNGFRVPFGKSKSGFLIWWVLFEKGFTGFEIRRIQIQINGLVIYAVPFTVDPKLVRWSSGISSWSVFIEAVEFPRCCHLPQNIWKH